MKARTMRRRLASMERRLRKDLDALSKMFPRVDWESGDDATEAIRNLATAVTYVRGMHEGMSDYGLEDALQEHAEPHPNL